MQVGGDLTCWPVHLQKDLGVAGPPRDRRARVSNLRLAGMGYETVGVVHIPPPDWKPTSNDTNVDLDVKQITSEKATDTMIEKSFDLILHLLKLRK